MKNVTLSVNDKLASRLTSLNPKELDRIVFMLQQILEEDRSLEELIQEARNQALSKGLTQEKLDKILGHLK